MNDAFLVGCFECFANLFRNFERFVNRNSAGTNPLSQCVAFNEFEYQEAQIRGLLEVVNRCNVWMIQRSQDFGFALESVDSVRISRKSIRQNLDRNFAFQFRVASPIYLTHST